ncbi:MAG: NADH-quinone oxidoreductase subunit NuoH [Chloroflexi bacterium]|nr:NADH-quinone oxidoreductase subunit NuoH [Chloroflexota bacterium]
MIDFLKDIGFSHDLAVLVAKSLGVFVVGGFGLLWTLLGIWLERKLAGRFQDRLGPNRVGPVGLVQSIADTVKIIIKEDIVPEGADRWVFNIAPVLSVMAVILIWAVIPFGPGLVGVDLSVGVGYIVAVGSLGAIAVVMAGWSSNNKFALLGAFRSVAQLISYEVPMVLALLVPVLLAGSMRLQVIIEQQYIMYLLAIPMTVFIFLTSSQAELGRGPFDLLEAESEIVAGFHIEYSGMKFGMFYVGEFLHAFTVGVLTSVFFLGGWRFFGLEDLIVILGLPVIGFLALIFKSLLAYIFLIWVRMTLPRLRIDQLLNLNWKFLVPLSLINLLVVAFVWKLIPDTDEIDSFGDAFWPSVALLVANIAMFVGMSVVLRERGRRERARIEALRGPVDDPGMGTNAVPAGTGD